MSLIIILGVVIFGAGFLVGFIVGGAMR